uniref:Family II esterase n=1 Tax=unidentified microorganism TaxID=81726 RepID=Q2YI79_9ZZZZ|nr:family II esterase [unidentified microorganism]
MADISTELQDIEQAKYGREVRGSIYTALEKMNEETTAAYSRAHMYKALSDEEISALGADSAKLVDPGNYYINKAKNWINVPDTAYTWAYIVLQFNANYVSQIAVNMSDTSANQVYWRLVRISTGVPYNDWQDVTGSAEIAALTEAVTGLSTKAVAAKGGLSDASDINQIYEPGVRAYYNTSYTPQNWPENVGLGTLITLAATSERTPSPLNRVQFISASQTDKLYFRAGTAIASNPQWGEWKEIETVAPGQAYDPDYALTYKGALTSAKNLNDETYWHSGMWVFYTLSQRPTNWPANASLGKLIVFGNGPSLSNTNMWVVQMVITRDQNTVWTRTGRGSDVWTAWKQVGGDTAQSRLYGKKCSIYGDSISTFDGYTSINMYPESSNPTVTDVSMTWWMRTINGLGMTFLKNASIGGRCVTEARHAAAVTHRTSAAYLQSNVDKLKDGSTLPDVIIVKIGVNDYNHGAWLGEFEDTRPFETETKTNYSTGTTTIQGIIPEFEDGVDGTAEQAPENAKNFTQGYQIMLRRLMQTYPLAEIWCCTIQHQKPKAHSAASPSTIADYDLREDDPEVNNKGESLQAYNNIIRKVAAQFGAHVLEHDKCGITRYNMNTYLGDTLHPNNSGMILIAEESIRTMR